MNTEAIKKYEPIFKAFAEAFGEAKKEVLVQCEKAKKKGNEPLAQIMATVSLTMAGLAQVCAKTFQQLAGITDDEIQQWK